MKKTIIFCGLCFFTAFISWSQVGVGTTDPQESLHVAGSNSTIRVEGLSDSNNSENLGGSDKYNVMVDSDGDLTLGKVSGAVVSASDQMPSPVIVKTTANSGLNSSELYVKTFIITQKALVVFNYTISMDFLRYDGFSTIEDTKAKIAHNYFYLGDGVTANTSKSYGMTSLVYSNGACDAASGFIYNNSSLTLALDPGTYSVHMQGAVYGGDVTPDAAFQVSYGQFDTLDIQALYY